MPVRRSNAWLIFTIAGFAAATLYAANVAPMAAFGIVGVGSVVALIVGPGGTAPGPAGRGG